MGFLQKKIAGLAVLGVLFLLSSPVLFFIMRPHDDFFYHLVQADQVDLQPMTSPGHNQYVAARGNIASPSFAASYISTGFLERALAFKFQIEGHSPNVFVYLDEGPVYERLVAAIEDDQREDGEEPGEDLAKLFTSDAEVDVTAPALAAVLAEPISIEGRVYQSDYGWLEPFTSFSRRDETDLEDYIEDRLGGDANKDIYWVIVASEAPSASRFWAGNAPIFAFGLVLGFIGSAAVIGWKLLAWASDDDSDSSVDSDATPAADMTAEDAQAAFVAEAIDEQPGHEAFLAEAIDDAIDDDALDQRVSSTFSEDQPVVRVDRPLLENIVLEHVESEKSSFVGWLFVGVFVSTIAFCLGVALTLSLVGAPAGLRMLAYVFSFRAFREEGGRELRRAPESFHPFIAHVVLANSSLDEETSGPALVIGSFEDESLVPASRLLEIADHAQEVYFLQEEDEVVDSSDAELAAILADDRYQENRRRRLPDSVAGGQGIYFFDVMLSLSDCRETSEGHVLACLAQPGDLGELIKLPWSAVEPAVSLS